MGDSYQAIYDAVRSRIGGVNVGEILQSAAREAFDISHVRAMLQGHVAAVGYETVRPSVIYRPRIYIDGNKWCALYGDNLQDGVAGFGDSPAEAMDAFDQAWNEKLVWPLPKKA